VHLTRTCFRGCPPLRWDSLLQAAPEAASIAVDRPYAIGTPLPDPSLFTHRWVRKVAVLSAQIERLQSSPIS